MGKLLRNGFILSWLAVAYLCSAQIMASVMDSSNNPQNASKLVASGMLGHYDADGNQVYYNNNGAGLLNSARSLTSPQSSCIDTNTHKIFVADAGNRRVLVFSLDSGNVLTSTTASYVLGAPNFNYQATSGSPTTSASNFSTVIGVACDSVNDRLFVADGGNNRVMIFSVASGVLATNMNASYFIGQSSPTGNSSATSQTGLYDPYGVSYDAGSTRLFVADTLNSRVLVFNVPTSTNLTGISASVVLGEPNFTSSTGGTTAQLMTNPISVAYDAGYSRLFVADTYNNRVIVFPSADVDHLATNASATIFLGQTSSTSSGTGSSANQMNTPYGVAYDSVTARLFVADSSNNRVTEFDASVANLVTHESYTITLGVSQGVNATKIATQASLYNPIGVNYDTVSNLLYVDDGVNRVMIFPAATGTLASNENASYELGHTDISGGYIWTAAHANNNADPRNLYNPHTAVIDTVHNRMFVSEWGDAGSTPLRVVVIPLSTNNQITTGIAQYVLGWPNLYTMATATLSAQVLGYNPGGIAYDSANQRLFVADTYSNRVVVFNVNTSTISSYEAADYFIGQVSSTASVAATTQSGLSGPSALAYDSAGQRLFVADSNNNRIMVFNVPTSTNLTGINAVSVLGQSDYVSSGHSNSQTGLYIKTPPAGLSSPMGNLDYDSAGQRLFVPDGNNNRVLIFNAASPITNGAAAINVLGQSGYNVSTSATTQNGMNEPQGVVYDQISGRLFVGEYNNRRTMIFDAAIATVQNGENAKAVIGQSSFTTNSSARDGFSGNGTPIGGFYIPSTNTYFEVQWAPDRIMQYNMIKIVTTSLPAGSVGVHYAQQVVITATQGANQTYSLFSGSLPSGLSLNTSTGLISGTPSGSGSYTFTVEADDNFSNGSVFFDRATYTISVP